MDKQYIVSVSGKQNRESFYDFIITNYDIKDLVDDDLIDGVFPFVVDFHENQFWICNSITCCACAAQNKQIINEKEFKRILKKI